MDNISRTCANMCGVILAIADASKTKPLLYQVVYKFIKITEKNTNMDAGQQQLYSAFAFVFIAKLHQFFRILAAFSQNSINTNKVENNAQTFDGKQVTRCRQSSRYSPSPFILLTGGMTTATMAVMAVMATTTMDVLLRLCFVL